MPDTNEISGVALQRQRRRLLGRCHHQWQAGSHHTVSLEHGLPPPLRWLADHCGPGPSSFRSGSGVRTPMGWGGHYTYAPEVLGPPLSFGERPRHFWLVDALGALPDDAARRAVLSAFGDKDNLLAWLAVGVVAGYMQLHAQHAEPAPRAAFWREHLPLLEKQPDKAVAITTAGRDVNDASPPLASYARYCLRRLQEERR